MRPTLVLLAVLPFAARAQRLDDLYSSRGDVRIENADAFTPLESGGRDGCRFDVARSEARDRLHVHTAITDAVYGVSHSNGGPISREFSVVPAIIGDCELGIAAFVPGRRDRVTLVPFYLGATPTLPAVAVGPRASPSTAQWALLMDGCVDGRTEQCVVYGSWDQVRLATDPRHWRVVDQPASDATGAALVGTDELGELRFEVFDGSDPAEQRLWRAWLHRGGASYESLTAGAVERVDVAARAPIRAYDEAGQTIVVDVNASAHAALHDRDGRRIETLSIAPESRRVEGVEGEAVVALVEGHLRAAIRFYGSERALLFSLDRSSAEWVRLDRDPPEGNGYGPAYYAGRRCRGGWCLTPRGFWE